LNSRYSFGGQSFFNWLIDGLVAATVQRTTTASTIAPNTTTPNKTGPSTTAPSATAPSTTAPGMEFDEALDGMFSDMDQDSQLSQLTSSELASSQLTSSQYSPLAAEYDGDSISVWQPSSPQGTISGLSDHSTLTPSASGSTSSWYTRNLQRRPWIWQHGVQVTHNGKPFWRCRYCRQNPKQYACGSTKHPIEHLRTHRLTERGLIEPEASNSIIRQAFSNSIPKIQFNSEVFKQLFVQWIILYHISFRQVEQPSFWLLLSYLTSVSASSTSISKSLPKSGNTVRAWAMQLFSEQKWALIRLLELPHVVHFTFDLWSSPNHLALLGLVAHWINLEGRTCCILLGLRKMCGAHTGETQSQVVLTLLQEYFLVEKVGYFMLDNASNNDTALACLSKK